MVEFELDPLNPTSQFIAVAVSGILGLMWFNKWLMWLIWIVGFGLWTWYNFFHQTREGGFNIE